MLNEINYFLVLRFGRFWESLYAALPNFREENSTLRYTIILSKIANSLFLLADHILWLGRADLCTISTEKWSRISNKYWLYSITMNVVRDFYELFNIIKNHKDLILPKSGINSLNDIVAVMTRTGMILKNNQEILIDTIKNGCDFFIPLTSLGHIKLSPGTVGMLGTISSIAGLLVVLDPKKKLVPS